ncbi:MAG: hydantoinase [Deltaproteobacteria bacterium]|nr:MAG: hydantoinase [Deltaproteobacteria bacterium]
MIIGLDVGGTHTDAVLIGCNGVENHVKVPTDPDNLFATVMECLNALIQGYQATDISRLVLSTTLATNLVVQNRLPQAALLVSGGPGLDPRLFQCCEQYHIIDGALDHNGREIEALDEKTVRRIGKTLQKADIPYVGVVSKFSVRNPDHELRMAELLKPYCKRVFMGHMFSGSLSFPRRIATTYLNTAVYPVHRDFFQAVERSLFEKGLKVPIRILKPDGGNMNLSGSLTYPGLTVLSGPAASVMGAIAHAPADKCCLVLDIGGTTTDMAIILDGAPVIAPHGITIGPYRTLIRALMTRSVGIGGDSVIHVDNRNLIVGPERAGVAAAHGGPQPTTTDALCVLGRLAEGDPELARQALQPIADALDMDISTAAEHIFATACRGILKSAEELVMHINSRPVYTVHEMFEGLQIKPDHILLLGGPADLFAEGLQQIFDGQVETLPRWQVKNAFGCALARTTCEVTVFADTAQKSIATQGENLHQRIPADFDLSDARNTATELVRKKAIERGANPDYLKIEILEESSFNMIRDFQFTGKNIRVRAQVKPGIIHGYDSVTEKITRNDL